eukprot:scaffold13329_cov209-Alexandrium_tamarense.AAC.5
MADLPTNAAAAAVAKTKEDDSDIEMEGMDMEEDEAVADDYDDEALEDVPGPKTEGEEEDIKVDEHELEELEEARMERMDLMAKELASKQAAKKEGEGGFDKFQYLIGQTETFLINHTNTIANTSSPPQKVPWQPTQSTKRRAPEENPTASQKQKKTLNYSKLPNPPVAPSTSNNNPRYWPIIARCIRISWKD